MSNESPLQTADQAHSSNEELAYREFARDVAVLKEFSAAGVLGALCSKTLKGAVRVPGYKLYRDQLLEASGNPTDPLEIMMIEQLSWAHHRIGNLHAQATDATSQELITALNTAAGRLMAEFRKTSLAIKEYKAPIIPRVVNVVQQQNLSAGDQQIALVEGGQSSTAPPENKKTRTEVASNQEAIVDVDIPEFDPKTTCRPTEPAEAPRFDGRRPRASTANRNCQPSLGQLNGSPDSGR